MKGVGAEFSGEPRFSMALRALGVFVLEAFELIVRLVCMHGMAGQAGNRSSREATGNRHGGVLASAGEDRAIVPPALPEKLAVSLQVRPAIRRRIRRRMLDVVARAVQIFPWPVQDSLVRVLHGKLISFDEDAMALTTNFTRSAMVELLGIENGRVVFCDRRGRR